MHSKQYIFFLPTLLMQIVFSIKLQKVNLPTEPHDQENTDVAVLTTPGWGNVKTPKKPGNAISSPWRWKQGTRCKVIPSNAKVQPMSQSRALNDAGKARESQIKIFLSPGSQLEGPEGAGSLPQPSSSSCQLSHPQRHRAPGVWIELLPLSPQ